MLFVALRNGDACLRAHTTTGASVDARAWSRTSGEIYLVLR
jgi:hypothetical protein